MAGEIDFLTILLWSPLILFIILLPVMDPLLKMLYVYCVQQYRARL